MSDEAEGGAGQESEDRTQLAKTLCAAVRDSDVERLRTLLSEQVNPNLADDRGATPLAWAALGGNPDVVDALLQAHADPNTECTDPGNAIKPPERVAPMVLAAIHGLAEAFIRLARAANAKTRRSAGKRIEKFQKAQDNKKRKRDPRILELHAAVDRDDAKRAATLIAEGVDVNVGDDVWGNRPLAKACANNNLEMVRVLLGAGAPPDGYLGTSLSPLSATTRLEIAKALLDAGADPNAPHYCGELTIFMASITHRLPELAKLLIDAGADLDAPPTNHGCPLSTALSLRSDDVARLLIEAGANIEQAPKGGCTPLMYAAAGGNEALVRVLLDLGANPNAFDPKSQKLVGQKITPLLLAEEKGHTHIAALLRERGASA
jgi:ankyrin repeat protein